MLGSRAGRAREGRELPMIRGGARSHEWSLRKPSSCDTKQSSKGRSGPQHAWGITPAGSHRARVWSREQPLSSPALSPGARLLSRHCSRGLPARLPNLTQLQHNYCRRRVQPAQPCCCPALSSLAAKGHPGAVVQSPSCSWWVKSNRGAQAVTA